MITFSPEILRASAALATTICVVFMVPIIKLIAESRKSTLRDWDVGIELSATGFTFCVGVMLTLLADSAHRPFFVLRVDYLSTFLLLAFIGVASIFLVMRSHQRFYHKGGAGSIPILVLNNTLGGFVLILALISM